MWNPFSKEEPRQLTVEQLWVYPIKSCRGSLIEESEYSSEGLAYDRQWMIVDAETHTFLTARTIPKMVLIRPVINYETQSLDITVPSPSSSSSSDSASSKTFSVPLAHPSTYLKDPENDPSLDHDFVVWQSEPQDGYAVGSPELIDALSEYMEKRVLLIRKGLTKRSVAEVPGVLHSEKLDPVLGFADFYAFLIASSTSLSELTSRIPSVSSSKEFNSSRWSPSEIAQRGGLEIQRFRPNIIVKGTETPFEEDGWKLIKIGQDEVEVCFRCARCMLPSVDPNTGVRDNLLPDAVMTDRKVSAVFPAKVNYGMLSAPRKPNGHLKVGDSVEVLDTYAKNADGGFTRNEDRRD
ncbi:MOSC domain-containing protein [Sporobolomyces salmoneus]|uniref:MOSC domain-containing protein n=1 Tax=Sporobolomyces salmoneus TaxID=183962 RepID=UPI00316E8D52